MSQHQQGVESVAGIVAKASPPVAVVAGHVVGINWQEIVWQLTAVYLVVMTAKALWDWIIKPRLDKK